VDNCSGDFEDKSLVPQPKKTMEDKEKSRGKRIRTLSTKAKIVSAEPLPKRSKKTKKDAKALIPAPAPAPPVSIPTVVSSLTELPYCVLRRLFCFLDVSALSRLTLTCRGLHNLLGQLVTVTLPFSDSFLDSLDKEERTFTKKLVVKLQLNRYRCIPLQRVESLKFHLSVLSLRNLRELDLLTDSDYGNNRTCQYFLRHVKSHIGPYMKNVTRFAVPMMIDTNYEKLFLASGRRLSVLGEDGEVGSLVKVLEMMPSLIELKIKVNVRMQTHDRNGFLREYSETYLKNLENLVTSVKAPILEVSFKNQEENTNISEKIPPVFKNGYVERLTIEGHCKLNIQLNMENLKELSITGIYDAVLCGHKKTKHKAGREDRQSHRPGLCVVVVASVYQNCPNLERFAGVDIGSVDQGLTFKKWNSQVKRLFFSQYKTEGGNLSFRVWSASRWGDSKQPALPSLIGMDRVYQPPAPPAPPVVVAAEAPQLIEPLPPQPAQNPIIVPPQNQIDDADLDIQVRHFEEERREDEDFDPVVENEARRLEAEDADYEALILAYEASNNPIFLQHGLAGGSAQELEAFWWGEVEWEDEVKDQDVTYLLTHSLNFSASCSTGECGNLQADNWPAKLSLQFLHKSLVEALGGEFFQVCRRVLLQPREGDIAALLPEMMRGIQHAALVYFPPDCFTKIMIILYSNEFKAFLGYIPNDQVGFLERLLVVIQQQETAQEQVELQTDGDKEEFQLPDQDAATARETPG